MSQLPGPPFTISLKAADSLAKIVESVTRLDLGTDFRLDVRLHRQHQVQAIYSSLAIEGNLLSAAEVSDVLNGRPVWGRPADIQEVKKAHAAYSQLLAFDPYNVEDLLTAHGLMTEGLIREAGQFRGGDVAVFDGEVPVHAGARPTFVPGLVVDLFDWARESDLHPVLRSAIVHCELETIHPFADGNGRIGRLWQTLILARWNDVFASLPMESVIFSNRPHYYQALRSAQRDNDATVFIEFSLRAILRAIDDVLVTYGARHSASVGATDGGRSGGRRSAQRVADAILKALRDDPRLTTAELSDLLGVSPRTVDRHVSTLKASGQLRREGSTKAGRWVVSTP
ncbi:MAG: Fic family protein [Nocardioides sp.]